MPGPPSAPRRPTALEKHGDRRVDDWYWLRDRDDPEVIAYLEAENAYTEAETAHLAELRERLFEEFRSRIVETDETVPARRDDRWYYRRTVEGLQYTLHCRRSGGEDGAEEILLDENELAEGREYFRLWAFEISPDHRLAAYLENTTGTDVHTLKIRDLDAARDLPDIVEGVSMSVAWSRDSRAVYYTRPDSTMRPFEVWRHVLGRPVDEDERLYEEQDVRFYVDVELPRSGEVVTVSSRSMVTTEDLVLEPGGPRSITGRRQGVEYDVDHRGEAFLGLTNDGAPNFKLVELPLDGGEPREILPERDGVRLAGLEAFAGHAVVSERGEALVRLRVVDPESGESRAIEQPETVYAARAGENLEYETDVFRYVYMSPVTPRSVYDYDVRTGERRLRKQDEVPGYDASLYTADRLWAPAQDGERVPVTLVYRCDRGRDGGPLLLYGYGAYESSIDPSFSPFLPSLLDRGVAFAIAHVRGGGEMGRRWYEAGKLERKTNTFTDFVAAAEHLIAEGWTAPGRIVARGRSAGGLLMGAVVNMRPDLFAAVVAEVPFVDAVTTMLDDSLPLTAIEWEEWGDPNDPEMYRLMKSYSPYDNVEPKDYPAMLVTAGLNDPRVAYFEPAKWVAKLRATKTDSNCLLLKTEMGAGHAGPSGRYESWREEAFVYAFILDSLGLT